MTRTRVKALKLHLFKKRLSSSLWSLSPRPQETSSSTPPSTKLSTESHSNTTTGQRSPATVPSSHSHWWMDMRAIGSMDKSKAWAPWHTPMELYSKDGGRMARKKEWASWASLVARSSMVFGKMTSSQPASWYSKMARMYTRATGSRSSELLLDRRPEDQTNSPPIEPHQSTPRGPICKNKLQHQSEPTLPSPKCKLNRMHLDKAYSSSKSIPRSMWTTLWDPPQSHKKHLK